MPDYSRRYKNFWPEGETWDNPNDYNAVTLGHVTKFLTGGWLLGMRFLQDPSDGERHMALLEDATTGDVLRAAAFAEPIAFAMPKWQSVYWHPRFRVEADEVWQTCIWYAAGNYSRQLDYLTGGSVTHGNIKLSNEDTGGPTAGLFSYSTDLNPWTAYSGSAYAIDVIYMEDE
jgi:hypothetical protein